MTLISRSLWVRLNRLRTEVGLFRSTMRKWGLVPSANCKCRAEEQTANHTASCLLYHPLNGTLGLAALDDDTDVDWLKTTIHSTPDDTIGPNEEVNVLVSLVIRPLTLMLGSRILNVGDAFLLMKVYVFNFLSLFLHLVRVGFGPALWEMEIATPYNYDSVRVTK